MARAAIFTVVRDEEIRLPLWLEYYTKTDADLYVLDNDSCPEALEVHLAAAARYRARLIPVHSDSAYDHDWLCQLVQRFQLFLLSSYRVVVFAEVDEFLLPDPTAYAYDLGEYLRRFEGPAICALGYDVIHHVEEGEPPIDWSQRPLLRQRRWWAPTASYNKPLIATRPLEWVPGFHYATTINWRMHGRLDPHLYLVHLHRIDQGFALERVARLRQFVSEAERQTWRGAHNYVDPEYLRQHWYWDSSGHIHEDKRAPLEPIPEAVREAI